MTENLVYMRISTAELVIVTKKDKIITMGVSKFVGFTRLDSMPGGGVAAGPLSSAAVICSGVGEEAVVAMEGGGSFEVYDQVDGWR